jgi:hypothetical protein
MWQGRHIFSCRLSTEDMQGTTGVRTIYFVHSTEGAKTGLTYCYVTISTSFAEWHKGSPLLSEQDAGKTIAS